MKRNIGVIAYKDKWLVEASYDMTLNEQRLMLVCVGMLNPRNPVPDEITIHAADMLRHFPDIGEANVARELAKAVNKLGVLRPFQRKVQCSSKDHDTHSLQRFCT